MIEKNMKITSVEKLKFNIEFSADFSITGWAVDTLKKEFPKSLLLVSSDLSKNTIIEANIDKTDINNIHNVQHSEKLGFKINLFDVFNSRIYDYYLQYQNKIIWSRKDFLNKINHVIIKKNISFPKEHGNNQIIFIYEENSYFHDLISALNSWNRDMFSKKYSVGVSFCFISIRDFGVKKKTLISNNKNILILPRALYKKTFQLSPSLCSKSTVFLLDKRINLDIDFHGMMSVVCKLANVANGIKLDALVLYRIFEVLVSYNSLLFDYETELYTYQKGCVKPWMSKKIKNIYQKKIKPDIIILSHQKIQRLSDVSETNSAIFVKTAVWRFLLDLSDKNLNVFLSIAYKRGMYISIFNEHSGELV
jgi:hypothetical protein